MTKLLIPLLIVGTLGLPASICAQGDSGAGHWTVESNVDAMTDQEIRSAVVVNADGHQFKVYRQGVGHVWASFRVAEGSLDILGRTVMLRVDKHEPLELTPTPTDMARVVGELVVFEPKWVNFHVWHAEGSSPTGGFLRDVLDGQRLLVRYTLATGGTRDTAFSLDEARHVIAEALRIADTPPADEVALERAKGTLNDACVKLATRPKVMVTCLDVAGECMKRSTAAAVRSCFVEAAPTDAVRALPPEPTP